MTTPRPVPPLVPPPARRPVPSPLSSSPVPDDLFARAQTIAGLRELADFLTNHPDLPVPEFGWDLSVYPSGADNAAERAEIDRIAAILGDPPYDGTGKGEHYTTSRSFGRITYRAVHIPRCDCHGRSR